MTKQKTMFVVTQTNFEYNDEVHSIGETEGGTPLAVFASRDDAREYIKQRTVEWLKGIYRLCDYGYGTGEIFSRKPSFIEVDEDKFFDMDSYEVDNLIGFTGDWRNAGVTGRSQEELEELASCLAFMPYFVTEVPLGTPV